MGYRGRRGIDAETAGYVLTPRFALTGGHRKGAAPHKRRPFALASFASPRIRHRGQKPLGAPRNSRTDTLRR